MSQVTQSAAGTGEDLLAGRYRLSTRVGIGGMATIYRAWDTTLHREVAVKVIHEHLADDVEIRDRFQLEARHAARLVHPHVVTVFDQGIGTMPDSRSGAPLPYMVMELVDGPSLRQVLYRRGRLSPAEALSIVIPVCDALAKAHASGLVHRDVKPANILLGRDGSVKVADFGIAHAITASREVTTGSLIGSVDYLAPELIRERHASPASDQYAVGVLAFELLTGRKPLPADSPRAVVARHAQEAIPVPSEIFPEVPPALDAVIARACALDPADRYEDLPAFADAFKAAVPAGPAPVLSAGPSFAAPAPTAAYRPPDTGSARGLDGEQARRRDAEAAAPSAWTTGGQDQRGPAPRAPNGTAPGQRRSPALSAQPWAAAGPSRDAAAPALETTPWPQDPMVGGRPTSGRSTSGRLTPGRHRDPADRRPDLPPWLRDALSAAMAMGFAAAARVKAAAAGITAAIGGGAASPAAARAGADPQPAPARSSGTAPQPPSRRVAGTAERVLGAALLLTLLGGLLLMAASRPPAVVAMPRVLELTEQEARRVLAEHEFAVQRDESYNTAPPGEVIAQLPDAGAPIREGAKVAIHVSKGPKGPHLIGSSP